MDITEVVKKGEIKIDTTTVKVTKTYKNDKPKELLGYIYNGVSLCGSLNAKPDGTLGLSLNANHGISKESLSGLLTQFTDIAYEMSNENK